MENANKYKTYVLQTSRLLLEHTSSETWINKECILIFWLFSVFSMSLISLAEVTLYPVNVILYSFSP